MLCLVLVEEEDPKETDRNPITNLVDGRRDVGKGEQVVQLLAAEVADADGLGQPSPVALLHLLPHTLHVHLHQVFLCQHRSRSRPSFRLRQPHAHREVDQVQVHILHLQIPERPAPGDRRPAAVNYQ